MNLLFVDDEALVLSALRRSLRANGGKLQTAFASSAEEALALLKVEPVDIVVSDYNMPRMNGLELLGRVKAEYPDTVRILLTASSPGLTCRTDVVAHQLIGKPWNQASLNNSLDRIFAVRSLLANKRFRSAASDVDSLPSVPDLLLKLNAVLADDKASADDIAAVIATDAAMSAKVLQLVNSAFFGMQAHSTSNISDAIVHLGTSMINAIATSLSVFCAFKNAERVPGFDIVDVQSGATMAAQLARKMLDNDECSDDAFTGALLRGVGQLVLACETPDYFAGVLRDAKAGGFPLHEVEEAASGITHAAVGAYLLGIWGLRTPVVDSVAHQHAPLPAEGREFDVVDAVHAAGLLIEEAMGAAQGVEVSALDPDWIEELGVRDKVKVWRQTAARLVRAI